MPINLNPFARVGQKNRRIKRLEMQIQSHDVQLQLFWELVSQMRDKVKERENKPKFYVKGG